MLFLPGDGVKGGAAFEDTGVCIKHTGSTLNWHVSVRESAIEVTHTFPARNNLVLESNALELYPSPNSLNGTLPGEHLSHCTTHRELSILSVFLSKLTPWFSNRQHPRSPRHTQVLCAQYLA